MSRLFYCLIIVTALNALSSLALLKEEDYDTCRKNIVEKCSLDPYFLSTLEIVDREIKLERGKADIYFMRQICVNAKGHMEKFKGCIKKNVGIDCWDWAVFRDIHKYPAKETQRELRRALPRYDEVYMIFQYNMCEKKFLRNEYLDIRSCANRDMLHVEEWNSTIDKIHDCIANEKPNEMQAAMDNMGMCKGRNREYACYVDVLLENCDKVRGVLLHLGKVPHESMNLTSEESLLIQFVLQTAESHDIHVPKFTDCAKFHTAFNTPLPMRPSATFYQAVLIVFFVLMAVLLFRFRHNGFRQVNRFIRQHF